MGPNSSLLFEQGATINSSTNSSHSRFLRLIAVFKLLKASLLIAAGVGIFRLVHADIAREIERWVVRFGFDPGSRYVLDAIQRATHLSPARIRGLGIVSFVYAALFLTEGIGLWLLKRWAEWFTVIATGSLIPLELYEVFHRPSLIRIGVLLINIAIVVYLIRQINIDRRSDKRQKDSGR